MAGGGYNTFNWRYTEIAQGTTTKTYAQVFVELGQAFKTFAIQNYTGCIIKINAIQVGWMGQATSTTDFFNIVNQNYTPTFSGLGIYHYPSDKLGLIIMYQLRGDGSTSTWAISSEIGSSQLISRYDIQYNEAAVGIFDLHFSVYRKKV